MSIFRINKTNNFTIMSNNHLKNKNLSLKAKGLLSVMLSLPDKWDYSIEGLSCICKEGKKAITSTLKELQKNDYLKITKMYPNQTKSKKIEYIYDIYEKPIKINKNSKKQDTPFVGLENVDVENVVLQNGTQLNTKNKIIKNKRKDIKEKFEQREYSAEDLQKLYANK